MLKEGEWGKTYAVSPVCAWFVEERLSQDTTWVSIELVYTGWLTVKADLLIEESVSVSSVRTSVFGSTSKKVTYWKPALEIISLAFGFVELSTTYRYGSVASS